jgi:ADP-ribose pyrophosphatase
MTFEVVGREVVLDGHLVVERRLVRAPDGSLLERFVLVHPEVAAVVALTSRRELVLVRQFRHPVQRDVVEIPGGRVEEGEDLAVAAARELVEETGYTPGSVHPLGSFYNSLGHSTQVTHLFLALDAVEGPRGVVGPEEEHSSVVLVPWDEVVTTLGVPGGTPGGVLLEDAKSNVGVERAARWLESQPR